MITDFYQNLDLLLGLSEKEITISHMTFRFLIIYLFGILILNHLNKRFLGKKTPLDIILRFVIGSSLANALTGSSPFFATCGAMLCIVFLNWILSYWTLYSPLIERLLKGTPVVLYKEGKFNSAAMKRHHFSKDDILSEMRKAGIDDLHEIKEIFLENSGEVSVITKHKKKDVHESY